MLYFYLSDKNSNMKRKKASHDHLICFQTHTPFSWFFVVVFVSCSFFIRLLFCLFCLLVGVVVVNFFLLLQLYKRPPDPRTYIFTYIHTHIDINTYTSIYLPTHIPTYLYTYMHMLITYIHIFIHGCLGGRMVSVAN